MRTIHRSCHRCPFPKPPPLLQATAVTPPRAQANFPHPQTIGSFLLQRVQHEDNLRVGHRQVCRSNAAVRNQMPSLSRDPWICHISA